MRESKIKPTILLLTYLLFSSLLIVKSSVGDDCVSRMYHLEAIEESNLVFVATTTAGPFPATLADYNDSSDLLAWGKAGSAGLTEDRITVTQGVPLQITFKVFNVDDNKNITPLTKAHMYIWHCDAIGKYSAVSSEGTSGQRWLRASQPIDSEGNVTFKTIIPGWYQGRILHYHIRIHLDDDSANTWEVTTQVFIENSVKNDILNDGVYSSNKNTLIEYSSDNIYTSLPTDLRDRLFLKLTGSKNDGYTTTFNMGVRASSVSEDNKNEDFDIGLLNSNDSYYFTQLNFLIFSILASILFI